MLLGILGFITSPLGKLATYAIAALVAAGVLFGIYKAWESNIRHAALLQFNNQQLELVVKQQQETMEKMREIQALQDKFSKELRNKNIEVEVKVDQAKRRLESKDGANKDSSEILRETVRELERLTSGKGSK